MHLAEFLKAELGKKSHESKKWRAAIIGLKGIAGFFGCAILIYIFRPEQAASVTTLFQFAATAWGGIIGLYVGAQGTVDFKTTAALTQMREEKTETRNEHVEKYERVEHVFTEGSPGAPTRRPWSLHQDEA